MTSKDLLYALDGVGDDLLTALDEAETRTRPEPRRPGLRRSLWTAAACAAVAALVLLTLPRLRQNPEPTPAATTETAAPQETPQPPAAQLPQLLWNEPGTPPPGVGGTDVAGVMMVSEPLTAAQLARCAPDTLPEGLRIRESAAHYYLKNGAGGLASVELRLSAPALTNRITLRLWLPDRPQYYDCIMEPKPTETAAGELEGLVYRAYQYEYWHGEGDSAEQPPTRWLSLFLSFERAGTAYQLVCEVPEAEEAQARDAFAALLQSYARSQNAPELESFRCGEYVHRDETLSPDAAQADPDFGAYYPAQPPEGMESDFIRRYQFQDSDNNLHANWTGDGASLEWLISYADAETQERLTRPEEREAYDISLYPGAWYQNAPPEVRDRLERPTFRIEPLRPDMIQSRQRSDGAVTWTVQFCVLYPSGVQIRVSGRNLDADWVYETLKSMS